jgi:hypothetical protein
LDGRCFGEGFDAGSALYVFWEGERGPKVRFLNLFGLPEMSLKCMQFQTYTESLVVC